MRRLQIAEPCPESWAAMQGSEDVRHCERCKKDVRTIRSLADVVPGTCVRIALPVVTAALLVSGCSSAYLEPSPTRTVVMPPPEAGPPAQLDDQIVGFIDEIVDPPPPTKR